MSVVLYNVTGPDSFWRVDATVQPVPGRLVVCSGDSRNEWFIHVDQLHFRQVLDALERRALPHADGPAGPADGVPSNAELGDAISQLLAREFSGRNGLLDEIGIFLTRAGIPYSTDVWPTY